VFIVPAGPCVGLCRLSQAPHAFHSSPLPLHTGSASRPAMNHHGDWSHSGKGDPLWLSDPDEGYLEATLVSMQGDKIIVEDKGGKVRVRVSLKGGAGAWTPTWPPMQSCLDRWGGN
jgi:hypothetical protein